MGTAKPTSAAEVVTLALDLTHHDTGVTVQVTITTEHGTVIIEVDPHTIH